MSFQPRSRTSGRWVCPHAMTRASVRADALDGDVRVEPGVEAGGLRAGRGVADEDHRPVVRAQATLGRQPAQPGDPLVTERVVGPFGGRPERVRDAVGHPRERRARVVEVGDGDVGVAADDRGAVGLHRAQDVDGAGRVGAVEGEVAGDRDEVRLLLARWPPARPRARWRCRGRRTARSTRVIEARLRRGMMKLSVASQAVSPSTLATPRPRPKRPPSFSIVTSRRSVSPGLTTRLKRQSSMPAKSPIRSPKPGCLAT